MTAALTPDVAAAAKVLISDVIFAATL